MLKELFSIFGVVKINNDNANKALDETTNKGKETARALSQHFETAGKIFVNTGKLVTSAGKVCTAATTGIVAGLATAVSRFDTLNNYPRVLSNLGFSAEEAQKSIDALSEGIDGLPTALDDAASGVQRLVAKNNDIDKSTKYFLAMNDAIVAGNAPTEQQKSAIEQLTQAYSKGKPELEEWKTLMMAMPGQLKQVATAMGYVDTDALYEALKNGKISMDDFMDAVVRLDEEGAEGIVSFQEQARNSCDSIGTAITNVANRFKKGFATILTSMNDAASNTAFGSIAGMINSFSNAVKNFLDKIGSAMKENEALNTFMNQIANAITKLNDGVNGLSTEQLDTFVTAIVNMAKAGPVLLAVGEGIKIAGNGFSGLSKAGKVVENIFGKLPEVINKTSTGFGEAKNIFSNFTGGVSDGIKMMFSNVTSRMSGITGALSSGFNYISSAGTVALSKVSNLFGNTFSKISGNIQLGLLDKFPGITLGLEKIKNSFGGLFNNILPKLGQFMPAFMSAFNITAIVGLVVAGLGLLQSNFGEQINQMATIAIEQGPTIITNLINGIVTKIPELIAQGSQLIQTLLNVIIANLPTLIQGGIQIIAALVTGIAQQLPTLIPKALELIITFVMGLLSNIDQLVDAGIQLIIGLAEGLINAIPILIEKAPTIIQKLLTAIINNAPKLISAGWELITKLVSGIVESLPKLVEAAGNIIQTIWNTLKELPGKALQWGKDMVQGLIDGIKNMAGSIGNAVSGIGDKIKSFLHFSRPDEGPLREYETWMPDMVKGLSSTLEKSAPMLYKTTKALAQKVSEGLNFSNIPKDMKTTISGSVLWDDSSMSTEPQAYSVSRASDNAQEYSKTYYNNNKDENLSNLVQKLIDILLAYFPQFAEIMKQPIVTEDGTIVAYYTPKINEELKRIRDKEERGS